MQKSHIKTYSSGSCLNEFKYVYNKNKANFIQFIEIEPSSKIKNSEKFKNKDNLKYNCNNMNEKFNKNYNKTN
jgi:hypothetical protein